MSGEWVIQAALAVPFTTTAETFTFRIGVTDYTATLAAGTWRIALAPSATDALRVLAASMLAASPSVPLGLTVDVSLGDDGLVAITSSSSFKLLTLHTTALGMALGFDGASATAATTQRAARPPWHLALFVALYGGAWRAVRSGALERSAGGAVYSFAGTLATWDRELSAELVPWSPSVAAEMGTPATPFYPEPQHREALGATTTARAWSLADVWTAAQGASARGGCALTLTWQTARTSTTERYDVGALAASTLEPARQDERLPRWIATRFGFVLPASGQTGTRA